MPLLFVNDVVSIDCCFDISCTDGARGEGIWIGDSDGIGNGGVYDDIGVWRASCLSSTVNCVTSRADGIFDVAGDGGVADARGDARDSDDSGTLGVGVFGDCIGNNGDCESGIVIPIFVFFINFLCTTILFFLRWNVSQTYRRVIKKKKMFSKNCFVIPR